MKRRSVEDSKTQQPKSEWAFKARFRRGTFGWKSQPALTRIKEAVSEIRKAARADPLRGAEGAVSLIERLSPALENIDGSSGAIGTAVNNAIVALVPIISSAAADAATRDAWLERLFQAHADDEIPYIEILAEYWGELCASEQTASAWADRLIWATRMALSSNPALRGHFHAAPACLSALYASRRFDELREVVGNDSLWAYKQWVAKALVAQGRHEEAVHYAESCRGPWSNSRSIDQFCEETLIGCGRADLAYANYALRADHGPTNLATFRSILKRYPDKRPADALNDLVASDPGNEGKWFAAAKDAGLYDEALRFARCSPCDPRTLTRASDDFLDTNPSFAAEAGLLALFWMIQGRGYELTGGDVLGAYFACMRASERTNDTARMRDTLRAWLDSGGPAAGFVGKILSPRL